MIEDEFNGFDTTIHRIIEYKKLKLRIYNYNNLKEKKYLIKYKTKFIGLILNNKTFINYLVSSIKNIFNR